MSNYASDIKTCVTSYKREQSVHKLAHLPYSKAGYDFECKTECATAIDTVNMLRVCSSRSM